MNHKKCRGALLYAAGRVQKSQLNAKLIVYFMTRIVLPFRCIFVLYCCFASYQVRLNSSSAAQKLCRTGRLNPEETC